MLNLIAAKVRKQVEEVRVQEEENQICSDLSNRVICRVFSYLFHYHKAVAVIH